MHNLTEYRIFLMPHGVGRGSLRFQGVEDAGPRNYNSLLAVLLVLVVLKI